MKNDTPSSPPSYKKKKKEMRQIQIFPQSAGPRAGHVVQNTR